ncbi:MAG: MotA/TolQ/ExbB proton channel family protein [Candidatus Binatia bacterium]
MKLGENSSQPIARVLAAGIAHRNPAPAKAMEALAQAEIPMLKSRLGILDTIVTLAPLLGLLGTVVGMIGSFDVMSEAGMGQPHAITGGVAEALITTATGLLIAILTLVSYNYFTAKVEREMDRMEHFSSSLELLLHEHAGSINAHSTPQHQESAHRDHPDDRHDFISTGLFHDLDLVDDPVQRHAGQSTQGGVRAAGAGRECRDHD